jgi:hypothetical protein
LALVAFMGCDEETPSDPQPTQEQPLVFLEMVRPSLALAGQPTPVVAGVFVGSNLCWSLKEAHVDVQGNDLFLRGTAVFTALGGGCPEALAFDSLEVVVPPLAAGTYRLRANGLLDTLVVADLGVEGPDRFAAHGTICGPTAETPCTTFRAVVLNQLRGKVVSVPPVVSCDNLALYGEIAEPDTCDGRPMYALRFRRAVFPIASAPSPTIGTR